MPLAVIVAAPCLRETSPAAIVGVPVGTRKSIVAVNVASGTAMTAPSAGVTKLALAAAIGCVPSTTVTVFDVAVVPAVQPAPIVIVMSPLPKPVTPVKAK